MICGPRFLKRQNAFDSAVRLLTLFAEFCGRAALVVDEELGEMALAVIAAGL